MAEPYSSGYHRLRSNSLVKELSTRELLESCKLPLTQSVFRQQKHAQTEVRWDALWADVYHIICTKPWMRYSGFAQKVVMQSIMNEVLLSQMDAAYIANQFRHASGFQKGRKSAALPERACRCAPALFCNLP